MENITGFIVEVKPIDDCPVEYNYEGVKKVLSPDEVFTGYFWQMTGSDKNKDWSVAHIERICLVDNKKLLFKYEGKAVFNINEVEITIKAKRGPNSYDKEFDKYETWNLE